MLRELKAKKAKYGFTKEYFGVSDIVPFGMLLAHLRARFDTVKFQESLKAKVDGTVEFHIYTDHDDVAEVIRIWPTRK